MTAAPPPLWTPPPERAQSSHLARFMREARPGRLFGSYAELWRWSVDDLEGFWAAVWRFAGIVSSAPYQRVLADPAMPGARWMSGARLNFARNLLRRADDHPALLSLSEHRPPAVTSYRELQRQVERCAAALAALGVKTGDRVAGYLPNVAPAVVAMLAATRLGAIWSSCSPDFGRQGVLDRFGQIEPRVLFAADGYPYNGKRHSVLDRVREIAGALESLERVVVVPWLEDSPDLAGLRGAVGWDAFLAEGSAAGGEPPRFEELPFDHPVYILFSSGTTGVPKCIVHGAGGTLVQHAKELLLHCDLGPEDNLFYFTTCGWMMWNWLVSGLLAGATITLYDGSPSHPSLERLWELADQHRFTIFGTSAKFLGACRSAGLSPGRTRSLASVRTILSTGSPLLPEDFDWVYSEVKRDVQLSSISGGTDIISCFVLGCPVLPVRRGEIQCRGLGMAVEAFGADGRPVRGTRGELVCTRPFPSMPVSFWRDPDGRRYRKAYFERWPGVWTHGDWVEITESDGVVIYGRSDATLNPGGVRIGTAEIYRQVETMEEVADSLAVAQAWQGDQRIVLFVVLRAPHALDRALEQRIKERIRAGTTPRHVPAKILAVPAIPYTLSGKKVELAVTEILHGREPANKDALANPAALDHFRRLPELAT